MGHKFKAGDLVTHERMRGDFSIGKVQSVVLNSGPKASLIEQRFILDEEGIRQGIYLGFRCRVATKKLSPYAPMSGAAE